MAEILAVRRVLQNEGLGPDRDHDGMFRMYIWTTTETKKRGKRGIYLHYSPRRIVALEGRSVRTINKQLLELGRGAKILREATIDKRTRRRFEVRHGG